MRPTIPILLALGAWGCAAERAQTVNFELAAANRALQHELSSPQSWTAETTVYVDEEGMVTQVVPVVEAPLEAETAQAKEIGVEDEALEVVTAPVQDESAPIAPTPGEEVGGWTSWQSEDPLSALQPSGPVDTFAVLGLTRAIDEHRQTLTLEARLEDKQRLIDALRTDVDSLSGGGPAGRASSGVSSQREAAARAETQRAQEALAETRQALEEAVGRSEQLQASLEEHEARTAELEAGLAELQERTQAQDALLAEAEQAQQLALAEARAQAQGRELALRTELEAQREQVTATEQAYRELLDRYQELEDQTAWDRKRERKELRRQRRAERWERLSWRLGRRDANRESSREHRLRSEAAALEQSRVNAREAEARAAQAAAEKDVSDIQAQAREAEIERQRQEELVALANAKVAELEQAQAAMLQERDELLAARARLLVERSQLQDSLEERGDRQRQLEEHVAALQRAEEVSGFVDESRQAEIRALQHEIETLKAQEAALEQVQGELAQARSREQALMKNQAELESLRARAMEAEGMESELASMEAELQAREARWEETLSPVQTMGLKVERQGDAAQILLPSDVLFAAGSPRLSAEGRAQIEQVGEAIAQRSDLQVQVEGHTDSQGSSRSNWDLAYARARTTLETLVEAGVDPSQISAASYGEQRPVATNDTPEGRAANRRVELVLTIVEE